MAIIKDGALHGVSATEFKEIAKDFSGELRRRCPDLKHTAALDLFTNLHYPDLSFASAVPMIEAKLTAKPLPLSFEAADFRAALARSKPKVQALVREPDILAEVMTRWSRTVGSLFEEEVDGGANRFLYESFLGTRTLEGHEPKAPEKFSMLLAVPRGGESQIIEAMKPFTKNDVELPGRDIGRLLKEQCKRSAAWVAKRAPSLLRGNKLSGYDFYFLDEKNPFGVERGAAQHGSRLFRLSRFAVFGSPRSCEALPGYPNTYLVGDAIEQYKNLYQLAGRSKIAANLTKLLSDVLPCLHDDSNKEFERHGLGAIFGKTLSLSFNRTPSLSATFIKAVNGVFIVSLYENDLMTLVDPIRHVEVGDYFLLKAALVRSGRSPELMEVVSKTKNRIRLRCIDYDTKPLGRDRVGFKKHQIIPKPGVYLSEAITKGVMAHDIPKTSVYSVFNAYDDFGQKRTDYAEHLHRPRVMSYSEL
jgi:hypothetical protein